ncbi:MAG: SprB repeat-containing protein [Flavobacteriales bacterium]
MLLILPGSPIWGQSLSVTLTPSDHNGYNISCFGKKNGTIDAAVTGGVPPYQYSWTTGDSIEDLSGLPSGYYELTVVDALGNGVRTPITLTEPEAMKVQMEPFKYPSGHHVSCHECYNGSIDVTVTQGVPPYAYDWGDEVYSEDRSGLGAMVYAVTVTDANGCEALSDQVHLRQPERNDWTMGGNSNTDPAQHYFGTTDLKDLVFRTNGTERLRLLGNGQVKFGGLASGILGVDGDGFLKDYPLAPAQPCATEVFPFWRTGGNFLETCEGTRNVLGSLDMQHVNFITNNTVRMRMTHTGHIQIGGSIEDWPHGSIDGRVNILNGHGSWLTFRTQGSTPQEDVGFWMFHNPPEQDRMSIMWTSATGGTNSVMSLYTNGKIQIGDVAVPSDTYTYGLYLEKGLLTEKVKVAVKTSEEWSDHVFQPNYRLMPLNELATYIERHGHLPGVPSAERMVEQGLDVVKTDAMLLEKIEELTLHVIRMAERVEELEKQNKELSVLVGKR